VMSNWENTTCTVVAAESAQGGDLMLIAPFCWLHRKGRR
jgi:hypothetical protein